MYRARDTHSHREVALKLLPDAATGDAAAEARFEREARAIASVNHPNICAIYDGGVDAGRRFLVMEPLHGETLQQRLARALFTIPELLDHGIALAAARPSRFAANRPIAERTCFHWAGALRDGDRATRVLRDHGCRGRRVDSER